MDAYFDYTNFRSYLDAFRKREFRECNDVLRSYINRRFTFNRNRMLEDPQIKKIFELWTRNYATNRHGTRNRWDTSFPTRPIDSDNFFVADSRNPNKLTSIYMLDGDDAAALAGHGALLVAKPGQEMAVINNLRVSEDFLQHIKNYPPKDQRDWSIIEKYASPCTDIIIADPWIFLHGKNHNKLRENNIYAIIDALIKHAQDIVLNIVIVAHDKKCTDDGKRVLKSVEFEEILKEIKDRVKRKVHREPNVTIVRPWQLHDRYIITNYKFIDSGATLTYFAEDGHNFTNGEFLHLNAAFSQDNQETRKRLIASVQAEVNARRNSMVGDRICNFLKMPQPAERPAEGEYVHLKRDEDGNVACDGAVAPYPLFERVTDKELEDRTYEITKVENNIKRNMDRYPYYITVKRVV